MALDHILFENNNLRKEVTSSKRGGLLNESLLPSVPPSSRTPLPDRHSTLVTDTRSRGQRACSTVILRSHLTLKMATGGEPLPATQETEWVCALWHTSRVPAEVQALCQHLVMQKWKRTSPCLWQVHGLMGEGGKTQNIQADPRPYCNFNPTLASVPPSHPLTATSSNKGTAQVFLHTLGHKPVHSHSCQSERSP